MKITIHRGQNQIGGSIIEIASDTTKIILDAGSELDEEIPVAPDVEGLFSERLLMTRSSSPTIMVITWVCVTRCCLKFRFISEKVLQM